MRDYSDEEVARVCHGAVRGFQCVLHDPDPSQPWDAEHSDVKDIAIAGVGLARRGASPRELHEAWCAAKQAAGWTWGPHKDWQHKTHPDLMPWFDLPPQKKRKVIIFQMNVLATLADIT